MRDRHHSFTTRTADDPDAEPLEPVSFDIDGERFTCRADLPGTLLFEHFARLGGGVVMSAGALLSFFEQAMEPAEYERFRKFCDDPDRDVDAQLLGDIYTHLLTEYNTLRPTKRPSRSSRGRSSTAPTSTGASSSPGSDGET